MRKLTLVIDATCRKKNNMVGYGPSACAVIFIDESGQILDKKTKYLGEMTNNRAEYEALLLALETGCEHCRDEIDIYSDSELLINQMTFKYKIKVKELKEYFDKAKSLEKRYKVVNYFYHPRNTRLGRIADKEANKAFDSRFNEA